MSIPLEVERLGSNGSTCLRVTFFSDRQHGPFDVTAANIGEESSRIAALIPETTAAAVLQQLQDELDTAEQDTSNILDRKDRTGTGRRFVAKNYTHADGPTIIRSAQKDYAWRGAVYGELDADLLRSEVRLWLDRHKVIVTRGDDQEEKPYRPSIGDVNEVRSAVEDLAYSPNRPPAWRDGGAGRPDPRSVIVFTNAIVDVSTNPPTQYGLTPNLFTTCGVPFAFNPKALPPAAWLAFLADIFEQDRQSIEALQEWFGYVLTADTSQQKMMLLVGPPRSGKGTIARVLAQLIGPANVASPTLASLATNFGLAPLLDKLLAIISDARLSSRTDQAITLERLLSISGEDFINVDRKFLPTLIEKLLVRLMLLSNELPRLNDPSGAIASRFIVLTLRKSYLGKEDVGLTDRLTQELPGIMLWALGGLRRLRQRGHFVQPDAANEALEELAAAVSPIRSFLSEWCNRGPEQEIVCGELFDAWRAWCEVQGRQPGSLQTFGVDLRAAFPALVVKQFREGGTRVRHYAGIGLQLFAQESTSQWRSKREGGNARG